MSCSIVEGAFIFLCDARCMSGVACSAYRDMLDDGDGHGDGDECISLNDDGKDCTCLEMDVRRGEKKGRDRPIMYQELGAEIGVGVVDMSR